MPLVLDDFPVPQDAMAAAVEGHLQDMHEAGQGKFSFVRKSGEITLAFGSILARGRSYDVALIRLACAMLENPKLGADFFVRMRSAPIHPLISQTGPLPDANFLTVSKAGTTRHRRIPPG